MKKIRKAIIPVAGFGTRFLPVTKAMPKEMLPIVDKPIIQYLVEEAVASGITDIIFVTGRGKRAIEDHFDTSYELEQTLVERDKHDLLKIVRPIASLARFTYVRQPMPLGNGDAVLRAKHLLADDEPVAVLFGDDLVDARVPALKQLITAYERYGDVTCAVSRVSPQRQHHYGMMEGKAISARIWEITNVLEKPDRRVHQHRDTRAILGRYILTPEFLAVLARAQKKLLSKTGYSRRATSIVKEIGITDGLEIYVRQRALYGVEIFGTWYDCGDKGEYVKANIAYAMKRPDLKREVMRFLRERTRR